MPLAAFVDPETTKIAWKPQDILGKTPADLAKSHAQFLKLEKTSAAVKREDRRDDDGHQEGGRSRWASTPSAIENEAKFELPATPFGTGPTQVIIHTNDDGTARSYGVWFRTANTFPEYGFPDAVRGAHQAVRRAVGTVEEDQGDARRADHLVRSASAGCAPRRGSRSPRISTSRSCATCRSRSSSARPVPGVGLREGRASADRCDARRDRRRPTARTTRSSATTRDTITMSLPPTDYDGETSKTTILMFVRGGKVGEWRHALPVRRLRAGEGRVRGPARGQARQAEAGEGPLPLRQGRLSTSSTASTRTSSTSRSRSSSPGGRRRRAPGCTMVASRNPADRVAGSDAWSASGP